VGSTTEKLDQAPERRLDENNAGISIEELRLWKTTYKNVGPTYDTFKITE
jgi:hypothetical protein